MEKKGGVRIIAHIDMDAFFASVEERDKPYLKGSPVAVGGDPEGGFGRGVIATCNYPARSYGLHSGMSLKIAWKLSEEAHKKGMPRVIFVRPGFRKYGAVSQKVFKIIKKFAPVFEVMSVDEGYADFSFTQSYSESFKLAKKIQKAIYDEEQLTASFGVGENKLIAKIASGFKKPNGITVVTSDESQTFLDALSIGKLPGVGKKTESVLLQKGFKKVADVRTASLSQYKKLLGKSGEGIFRYAHNDDTREVSTEQVIPKSIGEEETFHDDLRTFKEGSLYLKKTSKSLMEKLKKEGFTEARKVTLVVRFSNFETLTRGITLSVAIASAGKLELTGLKLLIPFFEKKENPQKLGIRLLGLRLEKLS